MAKGKSFEQLVHIIQVTLRDHTSTKVSPNVKLKSKTGQSRQFDVIIDTTTNGYEMRIAIECKDHGRKIEAKDIEAFQAKCDIVGDIHLKVFISKSGFQDGALSSAKYYGIKLHILEEGTSEMVLDLINPNAFYDLKMAINIDNIDVELLAEKKKYGPKKPIEFTDIVYYTDGHQSSYIDFINWMVCNSKALKKLKNSLVLLSPHLKEIGTLHEPHHVEISNEYNRPFAYLKVNKRAVYFRKVNLKLTVTVSEEKIYPDIKVMRNPNDDDVIAGVITIPQSDGTKLQIVVSAKSEDFKSYIIGLDNSIKHELKTLYTYDPKNQKYTPPDGQELWS